jgi:integrase
MNHISKGEEKTKKSLSLNQFIDASGKKIDGLYYGIKSDGTKYTIRSDRHRYFFPEEWLRFLSCVNSNKVILFETLLQTGGRIQEVLNLKPSDFTWDNNSVTLRVTKSKAKKGESKALGGQRRSFAVSSSFIRRMRKHIRENDIPDDEFIFKITKQSVSQLMKRALQKANLNAWEFSLHNIRKTSGMWLKTVQRRGADLDVSEICMRLGHDHNTFLKHYGSPSVFTDQQRDKIVEILGDVYKLK